MNRIPYVPQLRPGDDLPVIADVDDWFDLSVLDAATQQPQPAPDLSWRCTSTDPADPNARCALPVDHHGRDVINNWDLHQDEEGYQW